MYSKEDKSPHITITLWQDFTKFPGGRYVEDGPFSGENFRIRFLDSALKRYEKVTVDVDGTYGLPPGFLEEAFGGLVRVCKYKLSELKDRLQVVSKDPKVLQEIEQYMQEAHAASV